VTGNRSGTKEILSQKIPEKYQLALTELAEPTAVAGRLPMAAEMAPQTEKQVPKSIFEGCSTDGINILKNGAVEYLEILSMMLTRNRGRTCMSFFFQERSGAILTKRSFL
jgi:hypothetical protein